MEERIIIAASENMFLTVRSCSRERGNVGATKVLTWKYDGRFAVSGFLMTEVLVSIALLGIVMVSLYGGISSGFNVVRLARENLRATQILVQRTEDYRLYNWDQLTNSSIVAPSFVDYFNPTGTNSQSWGTLYQGDVSRTIPLDIPSAYRTNMRALGGDCLLDQLPIETLH
jgi:type II secretory pathway pseudopilin PulG